MARRSPAGGLGRRDFMWVAGLPLLEGLIQSNVPARITDAPAGGGLPGPLGVPGPFPGRVVEARNPAMIKNGIRMVALTLLIGGFAMVDTLGWIIQVELMFRIGVSGISLLIVWGAWFGTSVLRRPVGIEHA